MTDLTHEARAALQLARSAFTPSDEDRERVRAALAAHASAAPTASVRATSAPWRSTGVRRLAAATFVSASIVTVVVYLRGSSPGHGPHTPVGAGAQEPSVSAPQVAPVPAVSSDAHEHVTPAHMATGPSVANGRPKASTREGKHATAPRTPPAAHVASEVTHPAHSAPARAAETEPEVRAPAARREVISEPESKPRPAQPESDTIKEELQLLRTARAALDRNQPAGALDALDLHRRRFPKGVLRQERITAEVLALCMLGRVEEARTSARQLASIAPSSPHLARLRNSCVSDAL